MPEIEWIKLKTGLFSNAKIRYIRTLPEGNNILLIWIMLLTLAGRCNAMGMIFLTEKVPYTIPMLASELGFNQTTVELALRIMSELDMIEQEGNFLVITDWEHHQNADKLETIREQTRLRVEKHRKKRKELMCNVTGNVTSNATVTQSNAIEEETDKEKETDIDKELITNVINHLNQRANTKYRTTSNKTRTLIMARVHEGFSQDDFITVINNKCEEWIGTEFEKFLRPDTLFGTKFEGYLNQKNNKSQASGKKTATFCNIEQRQYDYDDLLRQING